MDAELTPEPKWNIERAEALLNSLKGVVSARIVARHGGIIEEIHLLTEGDVSAKQSVRNVESALLAHFGLKIDHRKVSVAQKDDEQGDAVKAFAFGSRSGEGRFLFVTHRVETEKAHRVVKSRVVCKSERKLLDASVRLPWRPPSVREA